MKDIILNMKEEFGRFCAEGGKVLPFLYSKVFPIIDSGDRVIFDFSDVRNMNSSFGNALFANLVRKYGKQVLPHIKVINTRENVKREITSSVSFGLIKKEAGNAA